MNKVYTWILLSIIALAGLVVLTTAYDCVSHWMNGTTPNWFEKSSFWYVILSIPIMIIGIKVSSVETDDEEN
jgi:uncharacterized membrane protein YhdT